MYQENIVRDKTLTDAAANIKADLQTKNLNSAIIAGVANHAIDYALNSDKTTGALNALETTTGIPGAHTDTSGNLLDASNNPVQQVDSVSGKPQYTTADGTTTTDATDANGKSNTPIMVKAPVTGTAVSAMISADAEAKYPGITDLMTKLDTATGDAVNDVIGQIATLMHGPSAKGSTTLTVSDLATIGLDPATTVGHLLSGGMAHAIQIDDTLMNVIGWTDKAAMQTALNLLGFTDPANPPTLEEYQAAVAKHLSEDAKPISDMMSTVNDPFASAAEREESLGKLRDMGYTGTLANAKDLSRLASDVAAAGTNITVGGKTFATMKDLLSDGTMTGLVGGYLNGTIPRDQLPASLANLVDKNYNIFTDIASEHKTETDHFTELQKAGSAATSGIPESLLPTIFKNYDPKSKWFSSELEGTSSTGIIGVLANSDAPADDRAAAIKMVSDLQSNFGANNPELFTKFISGMADADFDKLKDPTTMTNFASGLQLGANIDKVVNLVSPAGSDGSPTDPNKVDGRSTDPKSIERVLTTAIPELETIGGAGLADTINALSAVPSDNPEYEAAQSVLHSISHYFEPGVTVNDAVAGLHKLMDAAKVGSISGAASLSSGVDDLKTAIINGVKAGQGEIAKAQQAGVEQAAVKQFTSDAGFGDDFMSGVDLSSPVNSLTSLDIPFAENPAVAKVYNDTGRDSAVQGQQSNAVRGTAIETRMAQIKELMATTAAQGQPKIMDGLKSAFDKLQSKASEIVSENEKLAKVIKDYEDSKHNEINSLGYKIFKM